MVKPRAFLVRAVEIVIDRQARFMRRFNEGMAKGVGAT
jgi:hypothetical protein